MRLFALCCLAFVLAAGEAAVGTFPPDLVVKRTLNNPAGTGPVKLESFLGKVVLIDFWATWCGPCKAAIPHIRKLHEEYADQGLVVIGHTDESSRGLEEFVKTTPIPYLITVGDEIGTSWGVTGIPHVFILDPEGRIAWHGHPAALEEKIITGLLAKVKPSFPPVPRFARPSTDPKVVTLERQAEAGKVGSALKALAKLDSEAAKTTSEYLTAWQGEQDKTIDSLATAGDSYGAWRLADVMAAAYRGHDAYKTYQDRATELRKDPGYAIGKEYQKLIAIPPASRTDPRFAKMVEAFLKKHPDGYYAEQAGKLGG